MDIFLKIAQKNLDRINMMIFNEILTGVVPGELPESAVEVKKY